jgi:dethiobiotin synthetase
MSLPGLLVVGTDTGVGKTRVAAAIAQCMTRAGRKVGVLKPVATGAERVGDSLRSHDAEVLIASIGGGVEYVRVVPIAFEPPLAPSAAARLGGLPLDHARLIESVWQAIGWWSERADVMVIEGIGGLLCPLAEGTTVADLAIALDYPLVIVARRGLGTLNHTLLTVEAAQRRGLRLAGVVLNAADSAVDSLIAAANSDELARRLEGVALLGDLPHVADLSALSTFIERVDWYGLARTPRALAAPVTRPDCGSVADL